MRLYLDACILIYLVEKIAAYQPRIKTALSQRLGHRVCWTDLTRLEVRVKPLRDSSAELLARFEHFLESPATQHIPIGRETFDLATELRARHNLKTPDALHLAAALDAGCDEFWTNDDRLTKAAAGRIAIVAFD